MSTDSFTADQEGTNYVTPQGTSSSMKMGPSQSCYVLTSTIVLVDVDHSMSLMMEETFGPVVGVMKVRTDPDLHSKLRHVVVEARLIRGYRSRRTKKQSS